MRIPVVYGLIALGCVIPLWGSMEAATQLPVESGFFRQSVVRIMTTSTGGYGHGTGFCVTSEGHVVTNYHVVEDADNVHAVVRIGDEITVETASVLWQDAGVDLAILKISSGVLKPLSIAAGEEPKTGARVRALGYPALADDDAEVGRFWRKLSELGFTSFDDSAGQFKDATLAEVTIGHVRSVKTFSWRRNGQELRIINHGAEISSGNSGGPLVDECGRVVGVNTQGERDDFGNIVVRSSHVSALLGPLRGVTSAAILESDECEGGDIDPDQDPRVLALVVVSSLTAILALFFAIRKKNVIMDASTTVLRRLVGGGRDAGSGKVRRSDLMDSGGRPRRSDLMADTKVCFLLEGQNQESGNALVSISLTQSDFSGGKGALIVGRKRDNADKVIPNSSVSRKHAQLEIRDGRLRIQDCDSGNGTRVNGRELDPFQWFELSDGDSVEFGEVTLRLKVK